MDEASSLADSLTAFAGKVEELAGQYGPQVVDATLDAARVSAGSQLLAGIVVLILATTALAWARRQEAKAWKHGTANDEDGIFVFVLRAIAVALLIVTAVLLGNLWHWVGVFRPDIWLARSVMGL